MQQTVRASFLASGMTYSNQTSGRTGCLFYSKDAEELEGKRCRQRFGKSVIFTNVLCVLVVLYKTKYV